jgi:lipopolysaccharide transport system permease protein
VIRPSAGWRVIDLRELWQYRELLSYFVWRDIKVRYRQTVLGAAWAIIQPLLSMIIFTLCFSKLAGISSDGVPYPLFSFAALLPWTWFSNSLHTASHSLVGSSHLITKVYFPRLILPASAIVGGMVDFAIGFTVFLGLMLSYSLLPPVTALLTVPLLTLLVATLSLGLGFWFSALTVQYRDIRYVIPFVLQLGMFVSPVVYPLSLVPPGYRWLVRLNPMVGIIEGFRSSLFGHPWDWPGLLLGGTISVALLITGAFFFRRLERTFADLV